jgi:hypothetical protein
MRYLKSTLLLVFISFSVYAQRDFRSGFVVTTEGDTLKGQVDFNSLSSLVKSCLFRSSKQAETRSYLPAEIKAFGVNGNRNYQVKKLPVTGEIVFTEIIIGGKVSFLIFGNRLFLEKEGILTEIQSASASRINSQGVRVLAKTTDHIALLEQNFKECPSLQSKFATLPVREKQLTKLTEEYNTCVSSPQVNYKSQIPSGLCSVSMSAGLVYSEMSFRFIKDIRKSDFKVGPSPYVGVTLYFSFPKETEKFFFTTEMFVMKNHYAGSWRKDRLSTYEVNDYKRDVVSLTLPVGLMYSFSSKASSPYLKLGFSSNMVLHTSCSWKINTFINNGEVYQNEELKPGITRKISFRTWGAIGYRLKTGAKTRMTIEAKYETGDGFVESSYLGNTTIKNMCFIAGFIF